jgi:hypothetical protein
MPDPIPFPSRRAASPSGAGQPADVSSPPVPAALPQNVVSFPSKGSALGIPTWCPVPPYVGALVLGLTLAAAAINSTIEAHAAEIAQRTSIQEAAE